MAKVKKSDIGTWRSNKGFNDKLIKLAKSILKLGKITGTGWVSIHDTSYYVYGQRDEERLYGITLLEKARFHNRKLLEYKCFVYREDMELRKLLSLDETVCFILDDIQILVEQELDDVIQKWLDENKTKQDYIDALMSL